MGGAGGIPPAHCPASPRGSRAPPQNRSAGLERLQSQKELELAPSFRVAMPLLGGIQDSGRKHERDRQAPLRTWADSRGLSVRLPQSQFVALFLSSRPSWPTPSASAPANRHMPSTKGTVVDAEARLLQPFVAWHRDS